MNKPAVKAPAAPGAPVLTVMAKVSVELLPQPLLPFTVRLPEVAPVE